MPHNVRKCGPILVIISQSHSQMNCRKSLNKIYHLTKNRLRNLNVQINSTTLQHVTLYCTTKWHTAHWSILNSAWLLSVNTGIFWPINNCASRRGCTLTLPITCSCRCTTLQMWCKIVYLQYRSIRYAKSHFLCLCRLNSDVQHVLKLSAFSTHACFESKACTPAGGQWVHQ